MKIVFIFTQKKTKNDLEGIAHFSAFKLNNIIIMILSEMNNNKISNRKMPDFMGNSSFNDLLCGY